MSRLVLDTVERTAAAYITTLLGLLLADRIAETPGLAEAVVNLLATRLAE